MIIKAIHQQQIKEDNLLAIKNKIKNYKLTSEI